MSYINIPSRDQWEKLNAYLSDIANALSTQVDTSDWTSVQRAVQLGIAPTVFPVGTQFTVSHSTFGDIVFDVVAHDLYEVAKRDKTYDGEMRHSMTLLFHHSIMTMEFNGMGEAFYYADNELPAGTYNFTLTESLDKWEVGTYQFTLSKALPKGGLLILSGDSNSSLTTCKVYLAEDQYTKDWDTMSNVTLGSNGTNLGTFGNELNHVARVSHGSSNYAESDIRLWLNEHTDGSTPIWQPRTKFQYSPFWRSDTTGFYDEFFTGIDDVTFRGILRCVKLPCLANSVYESPDSSIKPGEEYIIDSDYFYIPSQKEIMGYSSFANDSSKLFPFYEGASSLDYIKYQDGVKKSWWTRSCDNRMQIDSPGKVIYINSDGKAYRDSPHNRREIIVACTIG